MTVKEIPLEKGPEVISQESSVKPTEAPKSHDDFVGQGTNLEPEEELVPEEIPEVPVPEEEEPDDEDAISLASLTTQMREMAAQVSNLTEGIAERDRLLQEQGIMEEEDADSVLAAEREEQLQQSHLNNLYQVMLVNPTFPGLEEVVSEENQNAVIRDYGKAYADENGVSQVEAEQAVYQGIMQQANPILWYYEKITELYYETPGEETPEVKTEDKQAVSTQSAPPSLGNASASLEVSSNSAWTEKRLDAMTEMQMLGVPGDIREKYLMGALPLEQELKNGRNYY